MTFTGRGGSNPPSDTPITSQNEQEPRKALGVQYSYEPTLDNRVRLDPLDPKTARHLGQCEFIGENDAAMLRVLLKVTDKSDYHWVECGGCGCGWQVPHYAESVG